jgi:hypothetical protein
MKKLNSEFYVQVLKRLLERISCLGPQFWWNGSGSFCTTTAPTILTRRGLEISHPPYVYSRDLAPVEILFPQSKNRPPRKKISGYRGRQEKCNRRITFSFSECLLWLFYADFWKINSVLQSRKISLKENKTISFLFYVYLFSQTEPRKFIVWPRTGQENKRIPG